MPELWERFKAGTALQVMSDLLNDYPEYTSLVMYLVKPKQWEVICPEEWEEAEEAGPRRSKRIQFEEAAI